jgi:integrase
MIDIDWRKDYKREFVCPHCGESGLRLWGKRDSLNYLTAKRLFKCLKCSKNILESYDIEVRFDKGNNQTNWRQDYQVGEFICPNLNCQARNMHLYGTTGGKRQFKCNTCGSFTVESIDFKPKSMSRFSHELPIIKAFIFEDDKWDLRTIIPVINKRDARLFANFQDIQLNSFRYQVKQYIYHQCILNKSPSTIHNKLDTLRLFSYYLTQENITSIEGINRNFILSFVIWDSSQRKGVGDRLIVLRDFFWTGTIQGWFKIDQDIISSEDFPKSKRGNPDPIPDSVREQIENNLYKLPDPIARMWIVSFFTAMRPNELALLKKDCLVQEGSSWKIIWWRQKGKDYHSVPITRVIAKVIQEQMEYIEQLWGDSWDYLFCHYQGLSKTDPSQPSLKPVKKVIHKLHSPFKIAIRSLINALDIRSENDEKADFSPRLVRSTRLTQLFEQGHDLAVISAWAGHQDLATTSTFYTHVSCDLIEKEAGHIQKALFNTDGKYLSYETLPKSFWNNPRAHQLELSGDHINTPIYGYCGLPLNEKCDKFRACYTCRCFVAVPEKLSIYIKTRDELRAKEAKAKTSGHDVLLEQLSRQADQLDKIIASLEGIV